MGSMNKYFESLLRELQKLPGNFPVIPLPPTIDIQHNDLSGLTVGDPHTQYLNTARGDARYYTQGAVDAAIGTRAPTSHGHSISDVSGLSGALAAKSDVGHGHTQADIVDLIGDLAAIVSALGGKSNVGHGHAVGDISGLGGAATLSVGTTPGTVAAGNHTHSQLHDAVTITDTDTIDLTLTGQQISGAVRLQQSLTSDASGVRLVGDSASPGNSKLYGTNGSGTKGWYDQPAGGGGGDEVLTWLSI